ncbi:hypothetical protein AACH28_22025 [Sphingobacterium thalpophilum]|uniref:Uncharacterized protein n=1 Tax=Sphingobacterium thalpophilum TaxID=259 RepID=A0ACD5C0P5_9SPHI
MKIAGTKSASDWKEIEKKLDLQNNTFWKEAFDFLYIRIQTRYINPIEEILRIKKFEGEGFAIVSLQCSLIETIECFVNGWKFRSNPRGWFKKNKSNNVKNHNNSTIFKSFFEKRSEFTEIPIDGNDFYVSVRCGLLHETQTTNNWKIRRNDSRKEFDWYSQSGDLKTIYPYQLNCILKSLIARFKTAIITGADFDEISSTCLRENFIDKMNHIYTKSM